jgi:UDP-2,3-diacylglucosamine hydrolase
MEKQPAYVVSDIHLGGVPVATERAFRGFLRHVAESGSELLINGDLFDFWFEYRSVIQGEHYRVLAALAELRESGLRIRFMGGNHDAWGGSFLRDRVGIEILREGDEIEIAGRRALVVHGDGLGSGDLGYRLLKRAIRNPISIRLFRALHPDVGSRVASMVSMTETKHGTPHMANPARAAKVREWAMEVLERRPELQLVLAGHTHTPTLEEKETGRYYINTGDWINHFTYLELPYLEKPKLLVWDRG